MAEVKMLLVGDVHVSDQTPGSRNEGYRDQILNKCREAVKIAGDEGCSHIIWLGDIYDNKNPSRVSYRTTSELCGILQSFNGENLILIGNHDISSGTLDSLPRQPINILGMLPNVQLLTVESLIIDGDIGLFPVPGIPIRGSEDWLSWYYTGSDLKKRIILAHQLIAKDISQYHEKAQDAFQDSKVIAKHTDAHLIVYGDLHDKQGAYKQEDVHFVNYGSICRLSVSSGGHKPEVVVLTVRDDEDRSISLKPIELTSVLPKEEVFRLEEHFVAKEHKADIDETIKKLKAGSIPKFSFDAIIEDVSGNKTVEIPVREKAIDLLESVR